MMVILNQDIMNLLEKFRLTKKDRMDGFIKIYQGVAVESSSERFQAGNFDLDFPLICIGFLATLYREQNIFCFSSHFLSSSV